jgi:phospholipid transport system substrate-binding protein
MKRLCIVFVDLAVLGRSALAAEPNAPKAAVRQDPVQLIRSTLDGVLSVLRNKALETEVRDKKISDIVTPAFDFPLTAQLSLGKENWSKLNPAQRRRFTDLFVQRLKDTYRDKLAQYTDEKVVFKPTVAKEGKVQIPTEVVAKDKTFTIVYHLYQSNKLWKVYDVEIEGISIVRTYRSQFDEVLAKGTVEDVLRQLEKPQDPNSPKR